VVRSARYLLIGLLVPLGWTDTARSNISEAAVLFLQIPMDVRGRGMGDVGVALPDIAFAIDVNPALLAETEYASAGYAWGDWLPTLPDDLKIKAAHGTIGTKILWNRLSVGFGYKRLNLGEQIRTDASGNVLGTFGTWEWAATFGAAVRITPNVAFGASIKRIESHLSDQGAGQERGSGEADGWALDWGVYFGGLLPQATFKGTRAEPKPVPRPWYDWSKTTQDGFGVGFAVRNTGNDISYIDANQADPLPQAWSLGFSYRPINTFDVGLLLVGEVKTDMVGTDHQSTYGWGAELSLFRFVDLRIGHVDDRDGDISALTWGVGLGIPLFQINYAMMAQESKPLDGTLIISFTSRW